MSTYNSDTKFLLAIKYLLNLAFVKEDLVFKHYKKILVWINENQVENLSDLSHILISSIWVLIIKIIKFGRIVYLIFQVGMLIKGF